MAFQASIAGNLGNAVITDLPFGAQMLGGGVFYRSNATGILVTFPSLDASTPDATSDQQSGS